MYFENIDWRYVVEIVLATIVGALIAAAGSIIINHLGNALNNYVNRKEYQIKQIENIAKIMKTLNEENIILKSENQSLIRENEQLKNQLSQLKGRKTL